MIKFELSDLKRLASTLETNSKVADALAEKHAKAREMAEATRQTKRAENGRHFAFVCREAARLLKIRRKKGDFQPPSWEETIDYCKEKHAAWPHDDILAWWNHFESQGWLVSGKTPMRSWQRAADNGFIRWKGMNPGKAVTSHTANAGNRAKGDPEGWEDFLKTIPRGYKEFRYEADWLKTAFARWKKAKG